MNKETIRNIQLGLFVTLGGGLLILALYFIGNSQNVFGKTFKLYAVFQNVRGLQPGNNVRYAGINVGTVQKIQILNDTAIKVEMTIEDDLKKVIKSNSLATIGTDGLMGNKLINIEPVNTSAKLVNPGDELSSVASVNTEDMLRTLATTNGNIAVVSANLRDLTNNINASKGTLYTVLMDTTIGVKVHGILNNVDKVSSNILNISSDIGNVTNDIKSGHGLVGTLVKDTVMATDLVQALQQIKLAGEQVNTSAEELKQILGKVNNGNGTIGTLLNDTVAANHLKVSLVNIENSTKGLNENMEALKHNFLLRGYFKKQEKQDKKAKAKAIKSNTTNQK